MNNATKVKKLLIVEDDADILEILGVIFSIEGYQVLLSESGAEINDLERLKPDLILLDIRLSLAGHEGEEICERIKSCRETEHIPVILLSAEANIRQICISCRANSYIKKPFDIDYLTKKVKEIIEN